MSSLKPEAFQFPTSLCGVLIFCWQTAPVRPPASRCLSIYLSLSTCLYQLVSINCSLSLTLSLSTCLYQLVSINLSISTCLYQLLAITLSLPPCLYHLLSINNMDKAAHANCPRTLRCFTLRCQRRVFTLFLTIFVDLFQLWRCLTGFNLSCQVSMTPVM